MKAAWSYYHNITNRYDLNLHRPEEDEPHILKFFIIICLTLHNYSPNLPMIQSASPHVLQYLVN